MAAIHQASSCAIASASTTCRARPSGYRWRGWLRRKLRLRPRIQSANSRTCSWGDSSAKQLCEVVFGANRGNLDLVNPVVAQHFQIDIFAGTTIAERIVEKPPIVHVVAVDRDHQVSLLQAGLFAWTSGHHACNHHVLAERGLEHAEPRARDRGGARAVLDQLIALGEGIVALH